MALYTDGDAVRKKQKGEKLCLLLSSKEDASAEIRHRKILDERAKQQNRVEKSEFFFSFAHSEPIDNKEPRKKTSCRNTK